MMDPIDDYIEPMMDPNFDDDLLGINADVGRYNKRRRDRKKATQGSSKKETQKKDSARKEELETFDIDVGGEADESQVEACKPVMSHKRSDHTGKMKDLVDRARHNFHLFTLIRNFFPNPDEIFQWGQLSYEHAGIYLYSVKYKGSSSLSFL